MSVDLRHGDWRTALAGEEWDAMIFDAPYGVRVHEFNSNVREDGYAEGGLRPDYKAWTPDDVMECVTSCSPRTRGWMAGLTSHDLIPAWEAAYAEAGRYCFPPVPCLIRGMSCRMMGDGPSSWAVYAMVARPRNKEFVAWGTLPGGYEGAATADTEWPAPHADEIVVALDAMREGRLDIVRKLLGQYGSAVIDAAYAGSAQPGAGGGRGKPDWLMSALVRDYSRRGDLVCDPFAGWGGTLAAAQMNERRAIGAEVDADAYREAVRRLKRPQQVDLFAAMGGV